MMIKCYYDAEEVLKMNFTHFFLFSKKKKKKKKRVESIWIRTVSLQIEHGDYACTDTPYIRDYQLLRWNELKRVSTPFNLNKVPQKMGTRERSF